MEHLTAENVLTVVAAPGAQPLEDAVIDALREALTGLHASVSPPQWLEPRRACDLAFEGLPPDMADAAVRQKTTELYGDSAGFDLFCQPQDGRRKRLLIADMDSTMVQGETLDDLAAFAGLKDKIAAITAQAMRGELEFEEALRARVAMLKGLEETAIARTLEHLEYMPGARTLVQTMAGQGAYCMLVSGGFRQFTGPVAAWCGFHEDRANQLMIADGRLTGVVAEPILGRDAKLQALLEMAGHHRIPLAETVAVGDGANDVDMLLAAGLGVAFHAKPLVREAARFKVDHGDLTALLFAQGYRRAEFAEG